MTLEAMLNALSASQKLEALNILWRDLSKNAPEFVSPDWHGQVLGERLAKPSTIPPLPLDAAIDDTRNRLNARRAQG
jgi:hypothetical protein